MAGLDYGEGYLVVRWNEGKDYSYWQDRIRVGVIICGRFGSGLGL